jgi:beta-glucosidase/6-phospho-beta-glucosidase/beta-galactosidase
MLTLLLVACVGDKPSPGETAEPVGFPDDFLWGTAVAGFQVEAGCPTVAPEECEDRASDWYQWVTDPELVADGSTYNAGWPISAAPGHYELYPEDLRLAREELGTNAFRTSLEWSRLFPDGAAESATTVEELDAHANPVARDHYRAYLQAVVDAGLTPVVTLNHYTLPLWIHDGKACHADVTTCEDRGWVDLARIEPAIALYSAWCAAEYGDLVDLWGTENEPLAIVLAGYLMPSADRTNPPGISGLADPAVGFSVFFNLIEGHAAMYDAVKANDGVDADRDGQASAIGLVSNLAAVRPLDEDEPLDVQGADHLNYVYNELFLNGAIRGELDRDLDGVAEEIRPDLAGRMDWLGVNYYTRITARGLPGPLFGDFPMTDFYPEVFWEEYPEGIYDVVALGTSYGLPVIITENGTQVTDESGEAFLRPHLSALRDAVADGHDVRGYFYWSLMDNYEWNHGMDWRMGMYAVDVETKARTRTAMADTYAQIVASGEP